MRIYKAPCALCAAVASMLWISALPVHGGLTAYDGFDYPDGSSLNGQNGGLGFAGGWSSSPATISGGSLSFGPLATNGNSVYSPYPSDGLERTLAVPLGVPGSTEFISFLVQAPQIQTNISFGLGLLGTGGNLFIGKPSALPANTQYVLEQFFGAGQVSSGITAVAGVTAFLVVRADFMADSDIFSLYVDPPAGGTQPITANAVKSDLDIGTVNAVQINGANFLFDEIRVGTTYADVVPTPSSTTLTWNNAGETGDGKTWDVASSQNWNAGYPSEFNQYNNVIFNDMNNGNYNVTVNAVVTPTAVTFANNTGNYTLSGTGGIVGAASLSVAGSAMVTVSTTNTYSGPTSVTGGTLVIGTSAALSSNSPVTVGNGTTPALLQLASGIGQATIPSLTINAGGVFDITNNTLLINYAGQTDPVATIRGYLKSAYQGGIWTGPGLTSSSVRGEVANAIVHGGGVWSIGYLDVSKDTAATSATQIYVEPALVGDANLDGSVTFIDLGIVAQNLGAINDD